LQLPVSLLRSAWVPLLEKENHEISGPASIAVSAIVDGATSFSASVRHQATDRAFGKQVPCDDAKDPLAETAVSVRAGDEQVGVFILRDPD
jgi:hypothetical protein